MSLILRRKAGGPGVDIFDGRMKVRVIAIDPDGTVHLAFNGDRNINIQREELTGKPINEEGKGNVKY